jgi:hypothetical protein
MAPGFAASCGLSQQERAMTGLVVFSIAFSIAALVAHRPDPHRVRWVRRRGVLGSSQKR